MKPSYSSCWSNVLSFSSRPAFPQLVCPIQPHPIVLSHNWGFLWGPKPIDQSRRQPRLVHLIKFHHCLIQCVNQLARPCIAVVHVMGHYSLLGAIWWCRAIYANALKGPRRFTGTQAIGLKIGHRLHREETSQKLLRPQRNEKVHWKKECWKNKV